MAYQVPPILFFHQQLEKHFRFLTDEFGFVKVNDYQIEPRAIFQNDDLDLWIGNDKGVYDAMFWLKTDVPWLLPYESKMFPVNDIVRMLAKDEFQALQAGLAKGGMTAEQECETMFRYFAESLKRHCVSIMRGDYQVLQQAYARRSNVVQ